MESETEQDFRKSLQTTEPSVYLAQPSKTEAVGEALEGETDPSATPKSKSVTVYSARPAHPPLRRSRRLATKNLRSLFRGPVSLGNQPVLELRKYLARPPGCSFLGSKATKARGFLGDREVEMQDIIIDSGSDITLISAKCLEEMVHPPKIKAGQRINLVQVTGRAKISGYVPIDLIFKTEDRSIKMNVEAYVVKGMTTPFILGNDFADQYSLSVLRQDGKTAIQFADTGISLEVENSTSSLTDDHGQAFKVFIGARDRTGRTRLHKRNQRQKRRQRSRSQDNLVRAKQMIIIPPESSKLVPVYAPFEDNVQTLFVERSFQTHKNMEDVFATTDALISSERPALHVANFSKHPMIIPAGQLLGKAFNPNKWLDRTENMGKTALTKAVTHARFIRLLMESNGSLDVLSHLVQGQTVSSAVQDLITSRGKDTVEDPSTTEPLEGGPKTGEPPEEIIDESQLLKEVDFSNHVSDSQRSVLEQVVLRHKLAFSLNGRLGHYNAKVEVPLKPNSTPVSLPPFPSSPAK